jgi:hypothetical protein
MKNRFIIFAVSLMIALSFISCSIEKPERDGGIELLKGKERFISEIKKMRNPQGIVPDSWGYPMTSSVVERSVTDYYEFFVFDEQTTLILLSQSGEFYFLKILSPEFYYFLGNELAQIKAGTLPKDKIVNSISYYREVGNYRIGIYFVPNEIKYDDDNNIADINSTTYVDPWRLIGAAEINYFYTPVYEEEKLFQIYNKGSMEERKKNLILTTSSPFTAPLNFLTTSTDLGFSLMFGENLSLTDDILGTADINFVDKEELTENFAAFFSLPLGNSNDTTRNYLDRDHNVDGLHGISVIIRGHDLSFLKTPVENEGLDLSQDVPVFKDILSFSFNGQFGPSKIDKTNHTVTVNCFDEVDRTAIAPSISLTSFASISPASGAARDFTNPVTYTVTDKNGSEQIWTVTISKGSPLSLLINEWADAGSNVDYIELKNYGASSISITDSNLMVKFGASPTTITLPTYLNNGEGDPASANSTSGGVSIAPGEIFLIVDNDVSIANITTIRGYNSFTGKIFLSTESTLIGSNDRLDDNYAYLEDDLGNIWSETPDPGEFGINIGTSTYSYLKDPSTWGYELNAWANSTATVRSAGTENPQ